LTQNRKKVEKSQKLTQNFYFIVS